MSISSSSLTIVCQNYPWKMVALLILRAHVIMRTAMGTAMGTGT